jgi:hypothetical protein
MHPFFDSSKLSEDELTAKINEVQSRLSYAQRVAYNGDMVRQFNAFLDQLIFEREERYRKEIFNQRQKDFPVIIETEPDLRVDKEQENSNKPGIPITNKPGKRGGDFSGANRPVIIKKYNDPT